MPGSIALPVSPGSPGPGPPVAGSDLHPISNSWGSGSGCGVRGLILSVRSREAYRDSPTRPRKHQAIVAKWTEALSGRLRYCEMSEFCANVYICSGQDCNIPYLLSCSPSDIRWPRRKDLTSSIRSYKQSLKKKKKEKKKHACIRFSQRGELVCIPVQVSFILLY